MALKKVLKRTLKGTARAGSTVVGSTPIGGAARAGKSMVALAAQARDGPGAMAARPGQGKAPGRPGFFSVGKKGRVGVVTKKGTVKTIATNTTAHIGRNLPRHRQLARLRQNLKGHVSDAKMILGLAAPGALAKAKRSTRFHLHRRKKR